MLVVLALKYKWQWWKPTLIAVISGFVLLPHLLANYKYTPEHDPFYTANIHARFYRNLEFGDLPGFPTSEEIQHNAWAGQKITMVEYLFTLHTPGQLISGGIVGLKRLFLTTHPQLILFHSRLLVICYIIGLLYLTIRGQWEIPAIMVFMVAPLLYLAGIGIDWRLVGTLLPFFLISVTVFGAVFYEFARDLYNKLSTA